MVTFVSNVLSVAAPKRTKQHCHEELGKVADDVLEVKSMLSRVLTVTENTKMPLSLQALFRDTFKCTICTGVPIKPPVIATKCCKSILGCEGCVNTWFSGPEACSKMCPKCRAERGLAETMRLNGLDNFLIELEKIITE